MPALAHIGIGLAAKRFFPYIPLWALLVSSMVLDILAFIFYFNAIWITHGLFMGVFWSTISMIVSTLVVMHFNSKEEQDKIRKPAKLSIVIGLLVFSHWVLDLIGWPLSVIDPTGTGVPLLFDDYVNIGLGVYTTWTGALLMDIGVFLAGLAVYVHYIKKIKKVN